ncbi:endo-1,4-beta-xylanase [Reichenbachiella sp.]|uniref:endo-1,4-beta-xylanase n=1 Tax=Reichenbachiella sp. TaxID=2184521 RepID=UPI003297B95C
MNKLKGVVVLFLSVITFALQAQIIDKSWGDCKKYLGNISRDLSAKNITTTPPNYLNYWNQVSPSNAGKWGFVENPRDVMNWGGLDKAYALAKDNGHVFKQHVFIWGNQQPKWMEDLPEDEQLAEIEEWIMAVCERYPDIDQIEVVNEALHAIPDGPGNGNYMNALGGTGATGYDWIIKAYELARQYCPKAELLINDYHILNNQNKRSQHKAIATLLKDRELLDGIGMQGHSFSVEDMTAEEMTAALDDLSTVGLPLYVTEFDVDADTINAVDPEVTQLLRYQELFPAIWEHPNIAGVTLWGYVKDQVWRETAYLVSDGTDLATESPALTWLKNYVTKENTVCGQENTTVLSAGHLENKLVSVYPNPTETLDDLVVNMDEIINSVTLMDINGRKLGTYNGNGTKRLSFSIEQKTGLYLLKMVGKSGTIETERLVVK